MGLAELIEIVCPAEAVLFDFDGPICDVFSGMSAQGIAAELIRDVRSRGVTLSISEASESDPLAVLQFVSVRYPGLVQRVEDALCAAELAAASYSEPTTGSGDCIDACERMGKRIVVVSNNSAPAIAEYLAIHNLDSRVDFVVGRDYGNPARMKPNPYPILCALDSLGIDARQAAFVGDSVTDVQACNAAGVPCIGYANKPHKSALLAGAHVVVDDMSVLADAIGQCPAG